MTDEQGSMEAALHRFTEDVATLKGEIGQVVVGQRQVVELTLTALLAGGHLLLEGVPGLGKTLLVKTLANATSLRFGRIQCTPDLMPADILGTRVLVEDGDGRRRFEFQRGPIFVEILLADEINRATPRTQSALLEAMQERAVTMAGTRHELSPFFVLATENPLEMEGTYPLPEAQLDRFLFKVQVPFPSVEELSVIVDRTTGQAAPEAHQVITGDDLQRMQDLVRQVPLSQDVKGYALSLVMASHPGHDGPAVVKQMVRYGSSPRGAQALIMGAKAHALMRGGLCVDVQDIQAVALPALRHRLIPSFEAEAEGVSMDSVVEAIVEAISPP